MLPRAEERLSVLYLLKHAGGDKLLVDYATQRVVLGAFLALLLHIEANDLLNFLPPVWAWGGFRALGLRI